MLKKIISMGLISAALVSAMPLCASAAWRGSYDSGYSYTDNSGTAVTGWQYIDGNWYCFDGQGMMQTGWVSYNNDWYYLWSNGAMATNSWVTTNNITYYVGSDGKMAHGVITVNNYQYDLSIPGSITSQQVK